MPDRLLPPHRPRLLRRPSTLARAELVFAVVAALAWPLPARADEEPEPPPPEPPPPARTVRFGSPGVFVLSSDAALGIGATTVENSDAESFFVSFAPGFDWFVAPHVSIGIDFFASYVSEHPPGSPQTQTTAVGGGPRFGVDIPLGRSLSLYPRLTAGLESVQRGSISHGDPWLDAYVPLLVHLGPGFFIGAGPSVFHAFSNEKTSDLSLGGERTFVRAHVTFGAWWGGEPAEGVKPAGIVRHDLTADVFGGRGQFAFSSELGSSAVFRTNGHGTDMGAFSATPGVDYFVIDHLSVGLAVTFSYEAARGIDQTGGAVAPRIGYDVGLARGLSLYPHLSTSIATYHVSGGNADAEALVFAGNLYAPFLVHVGHAFVGFGPFLSRELVHTKGNVATSYGADLVVGGWL